MNKNKHGNVIMLILNNKAIILTILMLIVSVIMTSGTALSN